MYWLAELSLALKTTIVHTSIWAALCGYLGTLILLATETKVGPAARRAWTIAVAAFAVHALSAFGVFYDWSHVVALDRTAADTEAATGLRIGWGLYLNYAFASIWIADAIWWWAVGDGPYRRRKRRVFFTLHGFFLFMVFNGAFFFVDSWIRWIGLAIFVIGVWAVIRIGVASARS